MSHIRVTTKIEITGCDGEHLVDVARTATGQAVTAGAFAAHVRSATRAVGDELADMLDAVFGSQSPPVIGD